MKPLHTQPNQSNPILEELWRVKDALAAEAGYDMDRFLQGLRKWETEHPQPGREIHAAEELRQWVAEAERSRTEAHTPALKEPPPRQD